MSMLRMLKRHKENYLTHTKKNEENACKIRSIKLETW